MENALYGGMEKDDFAKLSAQVAKLRLHAHNTTDSKAISQDMGAIDGILFAVDVLHGAAAKKAIIAVMHSVMAEAREAREG